MPNSLRNSIFFLNVRRTLPIAKYFFLRLPLVFQRIKRLCRTDFLGQKNLVFSETPDVFRNCCNRSRVSFGLSRILYTVYLGHLGRVSGVARTGSVRYNNFPEKTINGYKLFRGPTFWVESGSPSAKKCLDQVDPEI